MKGRRKLMVVILAMAAFAGSAFAQPSGPYRLAFITSTNPGCTHTDIADYNAYVQGLADAAGVGMGGTYGDLDWYVIGSTSLVDARDNTGTNPTVETGVPIYNMDGVTLIALDNADLWDGEIANPIGQDEYGNAKSHWPFTGSYWDGTLSTGHPNTGGGGLDNLTGEVTQGQSGVTTNWIWRQWTSDPAATELPLYAMSGVIPEPATMSLLVLGGLAVFRRRRNG
jgi:hypothetical protein